MLAKPTISTRSVQRSVCLEIGEGETWHHDCAEAHPDEGADEPQPARTDPENGDRHEREEHERWLQDEGDAGKKANRNASPC